MSKSLILTAFIIFIDWFDCTNDEGSKGFTLVSSQDWKRGGGFDNRLNDLFLLTVKDLREVLSSDVVMLFILFLL